MTTNKNKSGGSVTILKGVIMGCPFILFIVAIFLLSVWAYNGVLLSNPYFSFIFGKDAVTLKEDTEYVDPRTAEPGENAGEHFYVPEDFPIVQYGERWATMDIETAGVSNQPIFFGDSDDLLNKGIGHSTGSRFPGQMGNIVMSGHVTVLFKNLTDVKIGDDVKLHTKYGEYVYKVYETTIFDQFDATYILPEDGIERLTIYTCYPAGVRTKTQRYGLLCSKVSGKNWMENK